MHVILKHREQWINSVTSQEYFNKQKLINVVREMMRKMSGGPYGFVSVWPMTFSKYWSSVWGTLSNLIS